MPRSVRPRSVRPRSVRRRSVLASVPAVGAALAFSGGASARELAYAAFRVVRGAAGEPDEPDEPEITLPEGYTFVPGDEHAVASRAEFYGFVQGPANTKGIEVKVRWPRTPIEAVIHQNEYLALTRHRHDPDSVTFTLPMRLESVDENQPTIQVWSYPDISPGIYWRIEHNDPNRAAGPWTDVVWPDGEVTSVVHQLVATYAIWCDSGMIDIAAAKGHRFALMGFETNNTLHPDNPPHWHMAYNSGPDFNSPTHNPHFWIDERGRNFYNGMDVTDLGRLEYRVGDPAPVYDFMGDGHDGRGDLVVVFTIREDGGLDIEPADGPSYAIAAGRNGDLVSEVTVLRDDAPWLRVTTADQVRTGLLRIRITGLQDANENRREVWTYDRLTGELDDLGSGEPARCQPCSSVSTC